MTEANKIKNCVVHVVDLGASSAALGLLAVHAAMLAKLGKYNCMQIIERLHKMRQGTNFLVLINSLDEIIKSGRLPKMIGHIAKWLQLKLIIQLPPSGKPKVVGVCFSKIGGLKQIVKQVNAGINSKKSKSIAIVYSTTDLVADKFKEYVSQNTKLIPLYTMLASSVLVAHTGENGFAVAYSTQKICL